MESEIRILMLEDTLTDAELHLRELRRHGVPHVARRVETEHDFLREMESWVPDLILADYSLPSFDGLSALALARERRPEIPFIFVSGTMGEEIAIETLKNGATDYVLKERLCRLVPAVRRALREAEEQRRRREAERALQEETMERLRTLEELREKERLLMLQSRQAAMGEMINNIAHQWRQPLNELGLLVQMMPLAYEAGELSRESLEESVANAMELISHMSQTIKDFMGFFRPDKDKVLFKVGQVVAKTVTFVEDSFKSQDIRIEVVTIDDPLVNGFPAGYSHVLLNILHNARDAFSERRVASPRVTITVGEENERSVVTVADNAGGIPGEIMGKIFEPYFTTKGPDEGTGVGLFMSKTIIEKMGGVLDARNAGDGAEFRIQV